MRNKGGTAGIILVPCVGGEIFFGDGGTEDENDRGTNSV